MEGENENQEIEQLPVDLPEETPIIVIDAEPAPIAPESAATISQLVETIAGLTDSIQALRLEVQSERNANFETMNARLNSIEEKIDALQKIEATEQHHETVDSVVEEIKEVSNKPVNRWL